MDYDVKFVEYKGGNIKVSYTVTPLNSHEDENGGYPDEEE